MVRAYLIEAAAFSVENPLRMISGTGIYISRKGYVTFRRMVTGKIDVGRFYDEPEILAYLEEWLEGQNAGNGSINDLRSYAREICLSKLDSDLLMERGRDARNSMRSLEKIFGMCMRARTEKLPEKK